MLRKFRLPRPFERHSTAKRREGDRDAPPAPHLRGTIAPAWRPLCDTVATTRHPTRISLAAGRATARHRMRRDRPSGGRGARAYDPSRDRKACRRAGGAGDARSTATCPPPARRARRCRFREVRRERCVAARASMRIEAAARTGRRSAGPSTRMEQIISYIERGGERAGWANAQSIASTPCARNRSICSFIWASCSGLWPCHSGTSPVMRSGAWLR